MFTHSAAYYDAIYAATGKDYAAEVALLQTVIQHHKRSPGNRLLDVACGTGEHLAYLAQTYSAEGVDADPAMLQVAQQKLPAISFHLGDMVDFDLVDTFDIVICLFSAIGYVRTLPRLRQAIGNLCRHTTPGGLLIVEPWFAPGALQAGYVHGTFVDQPGLKIARMGVTELKDTLSILHFHYLIATAGAVHHITERHELGLFTPDDYVGALQAHGLTVIVDEHGLTGRGLYIGQKPASNVLHNRYTLRPLTSTDESFLWEMLYEAIYIPEGHPKPERTILQEPALAHYVAGWGKQPGDEGIVAVDTLSGQPVGVVWLRLFSAADPGWGFVDASTPEASIALLPAYRGQGIGTALLSALIAQLHGRYSALSLSVDPLNPAMHLYERLGFTTIGAVGTSLTMRKVLA